MKEASQQELKREREKIKQHCTDVQMHCEEHPANRTYCTVHTTILDACGPISMVFCVSVYSELCSRLNMP